MREDAREVHKLFKQIQYRPLLWTTAARYDAAPRAATLHKVFARNDWLDDQYIVTLQQCGNLVANGRQRRQLDFNQLVTAHDVDSVTADALLDERAFGGITLLQFAVERGFHLAVGYHGHPATGYAGCRVAAVGLMPKSSIVNSAVSS